MPENVYNYKTGWRKNNQNKKWFGFRLHLISDAAYELPVDFEVTKASSSELKETEKLLEGIKDNRPEELERSRYFLANCGYDSTNLIQWLETEGVSPS